MGRVRLVVLSVVAMVVIVTACPTIDAGESSFRCGTHLVTLGASRAEVRGLCGEPTRARVEEGDVRGRNGALLHLVRELWTYDFGTLRFTVALAFAGDELQSIERGDYGR